MGNNYNFKEKMEHYNNTHQKMYDPLKINSSNVVNNDKVNNEQF